MVDQPRDLSAAKFQFHATSLARAQGLVGVGTRQGSFEVPVASGGADWLEIQLEGQRLFVAGTASTPDLGVYRLGRGDVRFPAWPTRVGLEVSGLAAWQAGDGLQIVSPNAGAVMTGADSELPASPSLGSTAITGQSLDWKTTFAPLIDAGRGDTTWVTQMVAATSGITHYRTLARAGIARGFRLSDGQAATLAVTLAPVATRDLALHVKNTQFAAQRSQVGPDAGMAPAAMIAIRALPEVLARNNQFFATYYNGLPSLVEFGPLPATADLDQTVGYGDPFASQGAAWTEFVTLVYAFPVPVPTAKAIGSLPAMMVAAVPVSALAAGAAITPAISPVRNPKIGGQSLDTPRTGVGTSPTVTWEPPAIGTSTSYAVVVRAADASEAGVNLKPVATFYTSATSLEVPAPVLAPGGSYVLTITAIAAPGADLAAKPFVGVLPYASADHVTALITP